MRFLPLAAALTALLPSFAKGMPVITQEPQSQAIEAGDHASFSVTATGSGLGYAWFRGPRGNTSSPVAGANGPLLVTLPLRASESFWVRVTDATGQTDSIGVTATVAAPKSGNLLGVGRNNVGQLGSPLISAQLVPRLLAQDVVRAWANGLQTFFLKSDSSLWACGENSGGQLGDGTITDKAQPTLIAQNVVQVAAGYGHTLFVKADRSAWATGYNTYGELGLGHKTLQSTPQLVMNDVVEVAAGYMHSHLLKSDGSLWSTGSNSLNQLGDNSNTDKTSPVKVADNVATISTLAYHSLFVKVDGSLSGIGDNADEQIGLGNSSRTATPRQITTGVTECHAGGSHSFFRKANGSWWAMGDNLYGQLGTGNLQYQTTPVSVTTGLRDVSTGFNDTLWVREDGVILAMGENPYGKLGDGTLDATGVNSPKLTQSRGVRVVSASYHSLILDLRPQIAGQPQDQAVLPGQAATLSIQASDAGPLSYQWYGGEQGDISQPLGSGPTFTTPGLVASSSYWVRVSNANAAMDSRTVQVSVAQVPAISQAPQPVSIKAGDTTLLSAAASGGAISYQWYAGNPGDTSAPISGATNSYVLLPALYETQPFWVRATNIAGAVDSPAATVSVTPSPLAALRGAGSNSDRQITPDNVSTRPLPELICPQVLAYTASRLQTYFIKPDYTLWAMGAGYSTSKQLASDVIQVSAGGSTLHFLKRDGSLWANGTNSDGQFGNGTTESTTSPVMITTGVARIASGLNHSLFVKNDGSLWGSGLNEQGQLGIGIFDNQLSPVKIANDVSEVAVGSYYSHFVKLDGSAWAMGENSSRQLGTGGTSADRSIPQMIASGVRKIASGDGHTLLLKNDGTLWGCGANYYYQVGSDPFPYSPRLIASEVTDCDAGALFSMFTKASGTLWAMGRNAYGEFGNGTTVNSGPTPIQVGTGILGVQTGGFHTLTTDLRPAITSHPVSSMIPSGTATTLTVTVSDPGSTTYQWYLGESGDSSQPVAGAVAASFTTPLLTANTRYWVRVGNSNGTSDSRSALLTVVLPPVISSQPVDPASIGFGGNGVMSVSATGLALSYQWYRGSSGDTSAPILGATAPLLMTPPLATSGSFWVRVTNIAGTVDSSTVLVTVTTSYPAVLRASGANAKGQLGSSTGGTATSNFVDVSQPVVEMAAGGEHSLFVMADGGLRAMGSNTNGQLGDSTLTSRTTPIQVASGVIRVSAAKDHSLFIKQDGTLWGMGNSSSRQLGGIPSSYNITPSQLATGVAQVSTGDAHSLFLKVNGTLWVMGSNTYGQIGTSSSTPTQIASGVRRIAAGGNHSLFLKDDGTVWAMGLNTSGQLGDGSSSNRSTPVQVAADLAGGIRVVDIAAGGTHSLLLRSNGSVWACGLNNYGQAGLGSTTYGSSTWMQVTGAPAVVSALAAGSSHSFVLGSDGALYASGRNESGQLGTGNTGYRNTFGQVASGVIRVAAGGTHSLIAVSPPVIVAQPQEVGATPGQTPALSVTVAGMPSFTYQWYRGESGNTSQPIGAATSASYITPPFTVDASYWVRVAGPGGTVDSGVMRVIAVSFPDISNQPEAVLGVLGASSELSVTASGGALSYQWYYGNPGDSSDPIPGGNSARLTIPPLTASVSVWVRISNILGAVDSQAAWITAAQGQLVSLGARSSGQLGNGGTFEYPVPKQLATSVAKVRASYGGSFLLKTDGTLWGAGSLDWPDAPSSSPDSFVQLATGISDLDTGTSFTVFLKTDGTLWMFGAFPDSDSDTVLEYRDEPVQVAAGVIAVWAGNDHYIYLSSDGTLRGAGDNYYGQLGDGTTISRANPVVIATGVASASAGAFTTLFVKTDGSLFGCGANGGSLGNGSYSTAKTPVPIASGVSKAFSGYHTLFIKTDGSLWGCGSNSSGQLGDGSYSLRLTPVPITTGVVSASCGVNYSLFAKSDGSLWAMGQNLRGQFGTGTYESSNIPVPAAVAGDVTEIFTASTHSLFVDTAGKAWAMGANSSGQFGVPVDLTADAPQLLTGPVSQVSAAGDVSFFIQQDGSLWGMGDNRYGQLGDGSQRYRYTPVAIASGVKKAVAGGNHGLFLKNDDSLWGMGKNSDNRLTPSSASSLISPVKISEQVADMTASGYSTLFVKKDGTLWGMGDNSDYQLGLSSSSVNVPTQIATGVSRVSADGNYGRHSLFLKRDGSLWGMGYNFYRQSGGQDFYTKTPQQLASEVIDFAAGEDCSLWVTSDGTLWGIGSNPYGALGDPPGSTTHTLTPAAIAHDVARVWAGYCFTLYLKKDGTLWGLGYNDHGNLGDTGVESGGLPRLVASGVATAAAGGFHTLIVTAGPVITQQPESVTATAGSGAEFTVVAAGNGPLAYQWYRGLRGDPSQPLDGANAANFNAPPSAVPVNYWVRVSNPYAVLDSRTAVLAVTGGGDPHYQSWAITKGLADLSQDADPDQDGLSNYLEYFYNTNPLLRSHGQEPVAGIEWGSVNYLTMTFRRLRNSPVNYEPQWSPDLAHWSKPVSWYQTVVDEDVDGDGTTKLIKIFRPIDAEERRGFLRLELSEP